MTSLRRCLSMSALAAALAACGLLDAGGLFTSPVAMDTNCDQQACSCVGDGCSCDHEEESCSCLSQNCTTTSSLAGASCMGRGCECDGAWCRCSTIDCSVHAAEGADMGCVGVRCACDGGGCVCEDETGDACRCGHPGEVFEDVCPGASGD